MNPSPQRVAARWFQASRDREKPANAAERAQISAWRFGHITREQLEKKLGKGRADYLAPLKK